MDKITIDSYDNQAHEIAQSHSTLVPSRLYELASQYFVIGAKTADIGCGIGRDTHWLIQQGFPSIGIDASQKMLNEACSLYPNIDFFHDTLPDLNHINSSIFQNILCSAVLMHLNSGSLEPACTRLLQLLNTSGHLIVSFRSTNQISRREKGKLYESINTKKITNFFINNGCDILVQETEIEPSRLLKWQNLVIRKN